jgi:hypothetical protein
LDFVSLSDPKIPILNICMHHATYFSAVGGFQSVHAATLLVYLPGSSVRNLESDKVRSNITRVSPRAVGQLDIGCVALMGGPGFCYPAKTLLAPPPILVDSDGPGPVIRNCALPLHQECRCSKL